MMEIPPPKDGKIQLVYFTVSFDEWVKILRRFEEGDLTYGDTRKYVRDVKFNSFPKAFDVWDKLMEKFAKDEITKEDVVSEMVNAADKYLQGVEVNS